MGDVRASAWGRASIRWRCLWVVLGPGVGDLSCGGLFVFALNGSVFRQNTRLRCDSQLPCQWYQCCCRHGTNHGSGGQRCCSDAINWFKAQKERPRLSLRLLQPQTLHRCSGPHPHPHPHPGVE